MNIRTEPIPGADEDARRVNVRVTEAQPLQLFYGLGYSTDTGPRGTIQLTNTYSFENSKLSFRFEEAGPQAVLEPRNPNELPTLVPVGGNALAIFNLELLFQWRLSCLNTKGQNCVCRGGDGKKQTQHPDHRR